MFITRPFWAIHSFMQPSVRHSSCHQKSPLHHIDNHDQPMSSPSSVCTSLCSDTCKKSSLSSTSFPVSLDMHKNTIHQITTEPAPNVNSSVTIGTKVHTARVHFVESTTSSERSSLSLLFENTAHQIDPLGSNHVNCTFDSFISRQIIFILFAFHCGFHGRFAMHITHCCLFKICKKIRWDIWIHLRCSSFRVCAFRFVSFQTFLEKWYKCVLFWAEFETHGLHI